MIAVDLFAGCGGFTLGAELAGCSVAWAANHWPAAVDAHRDNHPHISHACQDLQQADWTQVPGHDLLLASLACQGHSPARCKDRPYHDAQRATAWAVVTCAEVAEQLAVLSKDETLALVGRTKLKAWMKDGEQRAVLDVVVDQILTTYRLRRKRAAMAGDAGGEGAGAADTRSPRHGPAGGRAGGGAGGGGHGDQRNLPGDGDDGWFHGVQP